MSIGRGRGRGRDRGRGRGRGRSRSRSRGSNATAHEDGDRAASKRAREGEAAVQSGNPPKRSNSGNACQEVIDLASDEESTAESSSGAGENGTRACVWVCKICTFRNENMAALTCEMCGSVR